MAKTFQVQSLEETCFSYILQELCEYPADVLALLPIYYRRKILHKIPVIDICRLEQTAFVSGLDMEKVWEHIYKGFTGHVLHCRPSKGTTWKEFLLESVCRTILRDDRPYGYSKWLSAAEKRRPLVDNEIVEDYPAEKQPMDVVNCLVAAKKDKESPKSSAKKQDNGDRPTVCVWMTRHEVTIHKGVVPPTPMYSESCKLSLSVSKRYTHLFTQDGHFLPDSTAIALLMEKCSYYPKDLCIFSREFGTFLEHFECEGTDFPLLVEFFKKIESLTFIGETNKQPPLSAYPGKNMKSTTVIPSKVLDMILLNPHPVLSSLRLCISNCASYITGSVDQILTTSFSGLRSFSLEARGMAVSPCPQFQKLMAITNHQQKLEEIKISIHEIRQSFGSGSFNPVHVVKSTPWSNLSFSLLNSWVQSCLQKPTLKHLDFTVTPITASVLQQVVLTFLSTPCSCEQTLTLSASNVDYKPDKSAPALVAPFLIDDDCSLQYKCLFLETSCGFSAQFATWLFTFKQVKLKKVTINSLHNLREDMISRIAEGSVDFESLIIRRAVFGRATVLDYRLLFAKPSLKNLYLQDCLRIDFSKVALGLVEQVRIGQLVNLEVSSSLVEEFQDSAGLKLFFAILLSLPQLFEFSLMLNVPLTGEHIAMIHSTWKQSLTRKVQLKALSVLVVESEKTTSMESDLLKIATTVNIRTIAISKKATKSPLNSSQTAMKPLPTLPTDGATKSLTLPQRATKPLSFPQRATKHLSFVRATKPLPFPTDRALKYKPLSFPDRATQPLSFSTDGGTKPPTLPDRVTKPLPTLPTDGATTLLSFLTDDEATEPPTCTLPDRAMKPLPTFPSDGAKKLLSFLTDDEATKPPTLPDRATKPLPTLPTDGATRPLSSPTPTFRYILHPKKVAMKPPAVTQHK